MILAPRASRYLGPDDQRRVWFEPFAGFQERAVVDGAFESLWGGAKGPGKSILLIASAARQIQKAAYKALIVRDTFKEMQDLLDRAHTMYGRLSAAERPSWRGDEQRFRFPSGASIHFGHLRTLADCEKYQGGEWAFLGWDEIGKQPDERVYTTMLAEVRCPDPTVVRMARLTANPGQAGNAWLKRRFVLPCGRMGERVHWDRFEFTTPLGGPQVAFLSRSFVPGRVTDNPIYANDPQYLAQLHALPDRQRRALLGGDWDAAGGMAFEELDAGRHFVRPFAPPAYWPLYAGHDWGFRHRWAFTWMAVSEDGRLYVVDTLWGRRHPDAQIAQRIVQRAPVQRMAAIYAGRDVFQQRDKARLDNTETTAERYQAEGLSVQPANTQRIFGHQLLIEALGWQATELLPEREPAMVVMDTPGNRRLYAQLESLVMDPDDPEQVLKVDATDESSDDDADGDDAYDALRYCVASRPQAATSQRDQRPFNINDPTVLRAEMERQRRHVSPHLRPGAGPLPLGELA